MSYLNGKWLHLKKEFSLNRYEQLIVKILRDYDGIHQIHKVNSLFQNELIKQRVGGSLSTAFREAVESLQEKKMITATTEELKLLVN